MKWIHSRRGAETLLAAVILSRSTSYLFSKTCLRTMGPFTLLSLRFGIAFGLLLVLFWRKLIGVSRGAVAGGALMGGTLFLMLTAELYGLQTTSAAAAALLENLAIIFVPFLESILRKRAPSAATLVSAAVAFGGVALLTLRDGSFRLTSGEWLCVFAAVQYAVGILLTDRLSHREDPLVLGVLQMGFMGLFSTLAALFTGTSRLPENGGEWGCVLALAIVCSGFGYTLQPVAQQGTTAERAGLFCALNPAVTAVLGSVFLHERLGVLGVLGAVLVLSGILISRLFPSCGQESDAEEKQESGGSTELTRPAVPCGGVKGH